MLRTLDAGAARAQIEIWLAHPPRNMRAALSEWVASHHVEI
jgi:hypothetical protein